MAQAHLTKWQITVNAHCSISISDFSKNYKITWHWKSKELNLFLIFVKAKHGITELSTGTVHSDWWCGVSGSINSSSHKQTNTHY